MADFLFLGNDEIESQLTRDRLTTKDEIKMLLLEAGEPGKVHQPYHHIPSYILTVSTVSGPEADETQPSRWIQ